MERGRLRPFSDRRPVGVDVTIATHMTTIIGFLGQHEGAIYPDAFARKAELIEHVHRRRDFNND